MDCSQILPGAVNSAPCSLATGYFNEHPFIVYASGRDVVILDGRLKHIQTLLGSDLGYGETPITCIHAAELVGKIAVTWDSDIVVFHPELLDDNPVHSNHEFPGHWILFQTIPLDYPVRSLSWDKEGKQLLVAGDVVSLWTYSADEPTNSLLPDPNVTTENGAWGELWRCSLAQPAVFLRFSPDGAMFATAGEDDHFVKIWYRSRIGAGGLGTAHLFSFVYVAHPMSVTGMAWRNTSAFMPRGCVPNVLLTYCRDNICRIWSHSVSQSPDSSANLRFFIAASIDPIADIPFKSMAPIEGMPFLVHWLQNKETTFTSKAEKTQKGSFLPLSRHSSLASFASSINEEMLQSWVCIEDTIPSPDQTSSHLPRIVSLDNYVRTGPRSSGEGSGGGLASPQKPSDTALAREKMAKKVFAGLMDEWCNSPDLLLCIHPGTGSLMVWTVEGLDAAHSTSRLCHISFSSCLPHIFPPHLAQSLHSSLLQFLIKEPDVVHTREMALTGSLADISIPVPQIRLPSGGTVMGAMADAKGGKEDVPKTKADSSLILISNHQNGSIHAWSVELTVQSNYYTSIAGLIHWGGTGGHHLEVRAVHRHPWLPVLMTVSIESDEIVEKEKQTGRRHVDNELIIWNAHLPGPLKHKSGLHELSRMSSPDPLSFQNVTWVPPISVSSSSKEGVLARSPSSGLFVANVGTELRLFQTSLYCTSKSSGKQKPSGQPDIFITSHFGKEGIRSVSIVEADMNQFQEIISLHAFRLCSLVTSHDIKKSLNHKFSKDVVVALIENRSSSSDSHSQKTSENSTSSSAAKQSYLHVWRVVISTHKHPSISGGGLKEGRSTNQDTLDGQSSVGAGDLAYQAQVEKVLCCFLPLPHKVSVVESSPACDISSSLQLQLPTLSAPYLFTTVCSDATLRCWQLTARSPLDSITMAAKNAAAHPTGTNRDQSSESQELKSQTFECLEFELNEVYVGSSSCQDGDGSSYKGPCGLDLRENPAVGDLPRKTDIPCSISNAYAGRMALAHLLTHAPDSLTSLRRTSVNPLGRYAAVTIWECESTGGLKWLCEESLFLSGVGGISQNASSSTQVDTVHLEWLPMENGAYLLATCFESIISIFGMALPQVEGDFSKLLTSQPNRFLVGKKSPTDISLTDSSRVSWVCLLQFPCAKRYPGLSISQFAYTGSNSLLISIGTEIHIYSCMVRGNKLEVFTPSQKGRKAISKTPGRVFRQKESLESSDGSGKMSDSDIVNLLDFAHARNTPLPQYHPKILLELMNSGKLHAVRAILVNLVKYLLLYENEGMSGEEVDHEREMSFNLNEEDTDKGTKRKRTMLSVSSDGQLRRSHGLSSKIEIETIPSLSLSKLGIFGSSSQVNQNREADRAEKGAEQPDDVVDEDDLFTLTADLATPREEDFSFSFNEDKQKELNFSEINPLTSDLTPEMSAKLSSILRYAQLSDLSDLEQVRLMSIAETFANTKMAFDNQTSTSFTAGSMSSPTTDSAPILGFTAGAGYASTPLTQGVGGGEAMDDCGIRYLLALKNYLSLSQSLPTGVRPGHLPPSDFIWAFHSDAEMELLSTLPCVQRDQLCWRELRDVGVGWWLRSLETLRRLMEKLAKTQFMKKQDPLDASLLYLAMKKKSLLKGLFRTASDSRMTQFFGENFTTTRWRKAALKNAFALLSKQRFEHAAAFFLLGGKLWDACEVCISRLHDLQLALVIARLYEGDGGPVYERILKECVLGINEESRGKDSQRSRYTGEPNPDPFLRSIACWLLQDYSTALETLLRSEHPATGTNGVPKSRAKSLDPSIFNFYFFLRSRPLLIRRNQHDYRSSLGNRSRSLVPTDSSHNFTASSARREPLSSVGDEPLTAWERNLLFSTAYYHLNHGCPLLALDVLSNLPKSSSLGADLNQIQRQWSESAKDVLRGEQKSGMKNKAMEPTASVTGMIQSGTLGDFNYTTDRQDLRREEKEEEEMDWSKPVSSVRGGEDEEDLDWSKPVGLSRKLEEEDIDWSKPITSQMLTGINGGGGQEEGEDDIDWSQPVSSQFEQKPRTPSLSPPSFDGRLTFSPPSDSAQLETSEDSDRSSSNQVSLTTLSSQGLFVLSLAEQLQYNACLSILTEELITIHLPPCCDFLWEKGGRAALPLLPLGRYQEQKQLASQIQENAFEKTVLHLRGMLVVWLRREMGIVKEICAFDESREDLEESSDDYVPAGYDLLTTLMNYTSLHAGTSPSLVTIKLELMHLMNTLLPWSTQLTRGGGEIEKERGSMATSSMPTTLGGAVPTYAVDPSQLPILTSCSLPANHLTNLTLHLRLMSASVIEVLANHLCPPVSSKPLPHIGKVFELCCAISNSITACLSPISITEIAPSLLLSPLSPGLVGNTSGGSGLSTPIPHTGVGDFSQSVDPRQKDRSPKILQKSGRGSSFNASESSEVPSTPNSKASKWPGVSKWPKVLQSDEGKDPTSMSLVLAECCIAVYIGLLSVAWSRHSISDLLLLLKNGPSQQFWYLAFGGGVDMKNREEKGPRSGGVGGGGEKSAFMKKVDNMKRGMKMLRRSSSQSGETAGHSVFVAPRKTLLELFLAGAVDGGSLSDQGITFTSRRTISNASTLSPLDMEEEEEEDDDYFDDEFEEGPKFRIDSLHKKEDDVRNPHNPDSFPWCLINLCITRMVQEGVRKILSTAGLEVLELVTASPLLYSTLKVLDEWESIFSRRLDALETVPEEIFTNEDEGAGTMFTGTGPAVMRHKFILEHENSPFEGQTAVAKEARELWTYLVHLDDCRELFIHHIFAGKGRGEESGVSSRPKSRSLYKAVDSVVWSFCIHPAAQWNPTIMAVALPREIVEIEIPDTAGLESMSYGDEESMMSVQSGTTLQKRSQSVAFTGAGDFILVQATPYLRSNASSSSLSENTVSKKYSSSSAMLHSQTGTPSSILLKRNVVGVKKIVPHPSMAYYLTGSIDGSVRMWEFGTQRVVSQQRPPGTPSITEIRFTSQGNKYGVTDTSGKLHLWQGIHTSTKTPYKVLDSGMRQLTDFLFLGSSSLIVAGGDSPDNKNLIIWDTLLPHKRNVVKEYVCHEAGGTSALAYSQLKQRMYSGGKRGEVCIFDIRQNALIQSITIHSSPITCMVVNDVEGYLVTGSSEGDIKVLDLTSMDELAVYLNQHGKSRLFRHDSGVTDLCIKPGGVLFSSGGDGSIRSRALP